MTRRFLITICFAVSLIEVLAQNDVTLWYNKPAVQWTDALPIGNGRLGAMIFGGVAEDRIQFNEETLWTGGPREYNRKGAYKYLEQIRQLLAEGKQKEAEQLAGEQFMGLRSAGGNRDQWVKDMRSMKGVQGNPAAPAFNDSKWKQMEVPSYEGWEAKGFDGLDGAVWLRTTFELPAAWLGKDLVLDLNRIRDVDFTYVNGHLAGTTATTEPRNYIIAKEWLVAGTNTIAVQVLNFYDKGGIAGYKDTSRHIGIYPKGDEAQKISLVKTWKYFVQNHLPPATPQYQASYQPFGDLTLLFKHNNPTAYQRTLNVEEAIATTTYTSNGVHYSREYFASQPHQAVVIRLSADRAGSISFNAVLSSPHKGYTTSKKNGNTLSMLVAVRYGVLKGMAQLQVVTKGGRVVVNGDSISVNNANEAILYLVAATNYVNYQNVSANAAVRCSKALAGLANKSYAQIKAGHIKEYQQYFDTFSIQLGQPVHAHLPTDQRLQQFATSNDPSFAALYLQYGRYLLISSSRPGTQPPNLQGIWNHLLTPPWGSKYTTNINAEMNYWPVELLNLSPLHQPLFKMIQELSITGSATAKEYYNAPGWVLHHNTDLWRGTAPINASNHGIWVTGGAWLCQHLWQHYQFTRNKQFLRDTAYPLMKQAALFFNKFLVRDASTGWLISTPSNSPEQGGLVAGPTMDHQIIRNLFGKVIAASQVLQTDAALRNMLQQQLPQIAPNQIGKHGQLQEWLQDVDDPNNHHRHVSHLWGVHPGSEINWDETPNIMKAARQSLLYRGDEATGWSLGWKINLWARFKDGDHAWKLVQMLLSPAGTGAGSYTNLFDAHPPFQIDGNFGGAAGIGEMLVQSHTQYIDLLPALPTALPDGEVKGICARGGFVCNITWKAGKLQQVEITSNAGADCLLRYNGQTNLFKTTKGKTYKLNSGLQML